LGERGGSVGDGEAEASAAGDGARDRGLSRERRLLRATGTDER
jgi:hypothetical protein